MTHKIGLAAQAVARPGTQIIACSPEDGPVSIEGHFDEAIATLGVLEEVRKGREQRGRRAHHRLFRRPWPAGGTRVRQRPGDRHRRSMQNGV